MEQWKCILGLWKHNWSRLSFNNQHYSQGTSFVRNNYYIYEFSYNDDTTVMTNNKNAVELGQYVSNVTNVADINGKSGYRFNLSHDDYISDAAFEGDIAEILFSKDLTPAESAKINAYLAAKWGLSADLILTTTALPMRLKSQRVVTQVMQPV